MARGGSALYEQREPVTAEGRQLGPFIAQFNLPRTAFEDLMTAWRWTSNSGV